MAIATIRKTIQNIALYSEQNNQLSSRQLTTTITILQRCVFGSFRISRFYWTAPLFYITILSLHLKTIATWRLQQSGKQSKYRSLFETKQSAGKQTTYYDCHYAIALCFWIVPYFTYLLDRSSTFSSYYQYLRRIYRQWCGKSKQTMMQNLGLGLNKTRTDV